jgi:selenide,water dikinase
LSKLPLQQHKDLLVGIETGDDAAVFKLTEDLALVQTVDFFPPIVDDPYAFGAIAVANAVSDVYAMGGVPLIALNIVCFPIDLDKAILSEILRGGYDKAQEAGLLIVGGHTVDDKEPKYGLAVTGLVKPGQQVTNAGAKPGDVLVLTKPLGTGAITTAAKNGVCPPGILEGAVAAMSTLNHQASHAMTAVGVHACTDITGFGLIGHLLGMVKGSKVGARIRLKDIPALPGARDLIAKGVVPGGTHRNLKSAGSAVRWGRGITEEGPLFLCDAQTSGGLLIAVPRPKLPALQSDLLARGVATTALIGEITGGPAGIITVAP